MEYTHVGEWCLIQWIEPALEKIGGVATVTEVTQQLNSDYDMLLSAKAVSNVCRKLEEDRKLIGVRENRGRVYHLPANAPLTPIALEPILREVVNKNPWVNVKTLVGLLAERGVKTNIQRLSRVLSDYDWVIKTRRRQGLIIGTTDLTTTSRFEKLEPVLREIIDENPWIYVKKLTELLAERGIDISPTQVGAALNSYDWAVKGRTNLGVVVATDTAPPKVQERKHVEPKPHISMLDLLNTQELELAVMDICENGRITPTELLNSLIAEGHKELNPTILGLILKSYDWLAKKRTSRGYILYAR